MSVEATRSVWRFSQSKGTARLILLAIADNADDGGLAWPGQQTIADKCLVSRRAVIDNLKVLEDSAELMVIRRRNLGNVYLIRLGDLPELHQKAHDEDPSFKCRFCTNDGRLNVQPSVGESADSRKDKCSPAYGNVKPAAHEPSLSVSEPSKKGGSLSRTKPQCHNCGQTMVDDGNVLACPDDKCGTYIAVGKAS